MKTSILIVTHGKDFPWLKYCLKSIQKFARGFHELVVAIPLNEPWGEVSDTINEYDGKIPLRIHVFDEWPGKGFCHHMWLIMCADQICPNAEMVLHMDADCIFCLPTEPKDYLREGGPLGLRPELIKARYDWIVKRFNNPAHYCWQKAVQDAIGSPKPEFEFMRRHPAVHWSATYPEARRLIMDHTGRPAEDYIRSTRNEHPQTFAEFPCLGEVAWRKFHDYYHWIDQETDPWPIDRMIQFWSHGGLTAHQEAWYGGQQRVVIPINEINRILA